MNLKDFREQTAHLDENTPIELLEKPSVTWAANQILIGQLRGTNKDVIVICPFGVNPSDTLMRDLNPNKLH